MNRRLFLTSALLAGSLGLALAGSSACYVATSYDCYYYYGYYHPYCYYGWYDAYSTSSDYSTVSYSLVDEDETPNPDPNLAVMAPDSTVNVTSYVYLADNGAAADPPDLGGFDGRYPCNQAKGEALTLCASDDEPFDDDEYIIVGFELENPFPQDDTTNFFSVGFAFDADGDPSNNFTPPAETANDYFGATDQWYIASYTPADGWRLDAFAWTGAEVVGISTKARVILEGSSGALVVPNSEFAVSLPGSRISLFRHVGDLGASGDWSGLVYPALGAPLAGP